MLIDIPDNIFTIEEGKTYSLLELIRDKVLPKIAELNEKIDDIPIESIDIRLTNAEGDIQTLTLSIEELQGDLTILEGKVENIIGINKVLSYISTLSQGVTYSDGTVRMNGNLIGNISGGGFTQQVLDVSFKLAGNNGINIDANEHDNGIVIRLDSSITNRLARTLVTPLVTPTENKLVGINTSNAQESIGIGDNLTFSNGRLSAVGQPTEYIKNASVSGNTLTLTNKDNTTVNFLAQHPLTAGQNISIENNVISASGGGSEPAAYLKNASVSGNTLTLTKKDNTTVNFQAQHPLTAGQNITIDNNVISASGGGEPAAYLKSASVSGNTLTLTKKDNTTVAFQAQHPLTAGQNITIENNVISATGGSGTPKYVHYLQLANNAPSTTSDMHVWFTLINNRSTRYSTLADVISAIDEIGEIGVSGFYYYSSNNYYQVVTLQKGQLANTIGGRVIKLGNSPAVNYYGSFTVTFNVTDVVKEV